MWPFNNKDKADETTSTEELGKTIRNLTDQIAALQQQVADGKKQIDQANEQAQDAQSKQKTAEQSNQSQGDSLNATQDVLRDTQSQVTKLEQQLGQLAQAKQEAEAAAAAATASAATAAASAATTAPAATMASAPMGGGNVLSAPSADAASIDGLSVGGTAWVQRAGGQNLRLRSAPGLNSDVLGSLHPGTQLSLHEGPQDEDGYSWWHISTGDGREGWVAGEELVTHQE